MLKEDLTNGDAILVRKRDPGKEVVRCHQLKVILCCSCWVHSESWGWKRETFL